MEQVLPRLRMPEAAFAAPDRAFDNNPTEICSKSASAAGEHARALAEANPRVGLIACEVFENGICSMLSALVPDDGTEAIPR